MASPLTVDSRSTTSEEELETRSLGDSVLDYPIFLNRRYHKYKEGSYNLPNDEQEQYREHYQYYVIKAIQRNNLLFAPISPDAERILDVGTGTGLWPIELADSGRFPHAEITGIDLSPIQPEEVPPNVYFEVQDCAEQDWARPLDSYDLIHSRCLLGSLQNFQAYIKTAKQYLKPGEGWIECCEIDPQPMCDDGTMPNDWGLKVFEETLRQAFLGCGRETRIASKLKGWLEEAGFVDVQQVAVKLPLGSWPANRELKEIGRVWADTMSDSLPAFSYRVFFEQLDWSREEIELFLAGTRKSLQQRRVHAYEFVYSVVGRRPSAEEAAEMEKKSADAKPVR